MILRGGASSSAPCPPVLLTPFLSIYPSIYFIPCASPRPLIARTGFTSLAVALTQSLRAAGDMVLAAPIFTSSDDASGRVIPFGGTSKLLPGGFEPACSGANSSPNTAADRISHHSAPGLKSAHPTMFSKIPIFVLCALSHSNLLGKQRSPVPLTSQCALR
ncbi:hypothetical protein C8J57DRAFT_485280 [Mycena rebaudengoi]|nr:hypothetical protein C8J57DRAFT_485280 [Mycena rebaudengoi]